jgi:hypothetical protein
VQVRSLVEGVHDVLGFGRRERLRGQEEARVVIDHVQDLHVLAAGEMPVGDVGLPCLVR